MTTARSFGRGSEFDRAADSHPLLWSAFTLLAFDELERHINLQQLTTFADDYLASWLGHVVCGEVSPKIVFHHDAPVNIIRPLPLMLVWVAAGSWPTTTSLPLQHTSGSSIPLHEQPMEDWTALREDTLREIAMCFSQLEQVGQGVIAGEMAIRLNRLLRPLGWQCFNAAAGWQETLVSCRPGYRQQLMPG